MTSKETDELTGVEKIERWNPTPSKQTSLECMPLPSTLGLQRAKGNYLKCHRQGKFAQALPENKNKIKTGVGSLLN